MDITIAAPGLDRLERKYRQAPAIIAAEFAQAVENSTLEAERQIVQRTPANRSRLRNAIATRQERTEDTVRGIVEVAGLPYAIPVEMGRLPGKMPPVDAIQRWVHDKGLGGRTRTVKRGKNAGQEVLVRGGAKVERQIAWAIALAIKKRGTRGAHMFRDGADASRPFIRREFEGAMVRVRRRLESGA